MNKGRNIAILMCCLLSLSVLTFLMWINSGNKSGVVDKTRYILDRTEDDAVYYEFFFEGDEIMEGMVVLGEDGVQTVTINLRIYDQEDATGDNGEIIIREDRFYTLQSYAYTYYVTGTDRDDARVTYSKADNAMFGEQEGAYERFSEDLFVTMLFGKKPLLILWEAIFVASIAALGGLTIFYAENLWHFVNKKGVEEDPAWEDMAIYKKIGGGIIGFAVLLLILFVIF